MHYSARGGTKRTSLDGTYGEQQCDVVSTSVTKCRTPRFGQKVLRGTWVSTRGLSLCLSTPVNCTPQQLHQRALVAIRLPWGIGAAQLVVGAIYVMSLWMFRIRDPPRLTMDNVKGLIPIAMCHVLTHVCGTVGQGGIM